MRGWLAMIYIAMFAGRLPKGPGEWLVVGAVAAVVAWIQYAKKQE
jgi:hypothetical protein